MNETEIRRYAALMKELGLTGLEITDHDQVVRLERTVPAASAAAQVVPEVQEESLPAADAGTYVTSPLVGMFYAAPAENARPYVSVGDAVRKGQTLCIVEAMKMMNEICAEQDGTIAEVCVNNGEPVQYGTPLFRVEMRQ